MQIEFPVLFQNNLAISLSYILRSILVLNRTWKQRFSLQSSELLTAIRIKPCVPRFVAVRTYGVIVI